MASSASDFGIWEMVSHSRDLAEFLTYPHGRPPRSISTGSVINGT